MCSSAKLVMSKDNTVAMQGNNIPCGSLSLGINLFGCHHICLALADKAQRVLSAQI
jgi:hypothetical protein